MVVTPARGPHSLSPAEWQEWSNLPWLADEAPGGAEIQFCLRLIESAGLAETAAKYLRQELPEVASEFAAQYVGIVRRGPEWETIAEFGRQPLESMPYRFFSEALERDAGGWVHVDAASGKGSWSFCAAPLHNEGPSAELLVLCGRGLGQHSLPGVLAAARGLASGLEMTRRREALGERLDRFRTILRITSELGAARETKPMLEMIAAEAARLLGVERARVFVWDPGHHELAAFAARGVEGNLRRLPDNAGVEGECLHTGKAIVVHDAGRDSRFKYEVGARTGSQSRNLLCVPLVDSHGERIGVLEAVNKHQGSFTADDEESLTALGVQAAAALANTREREHLVRRHQQVTAQVTQGTELVGESPAIAALRSTVEWLAGSDLPVLLVGESGTGKGVVAQALHYCGPRRDHPYVAVNCAAVAESLLEGELFGHENGASTDSREERRGKIELADGGTLFLDGIGDLGAGGQDKLLRVLEHKAILRGGGSQPIRTNVRIVAATNGPLAQAVREKKFREDLYYRLSVVALDLPPLRDRPADILPLADHFLNRFCTQARCKNKTLTAESRTRLVAHAWPGNVRELRNLMERITFSSPTDCVDPSDLAFLLGSDSTASTADLELTEATARFQQEYIRRMIKRAAGNMTAAAELLGLHRSNLYRKMRQLKMSEAREGDV